MTEHKLMRRVAGPHNIRLDGIGDLLHRARGASVFDIGCNRGMVAYDFLLNGAAVIHGCDFYERGIEVARRNIEEARENYVDCRHVESQFEVIDLTGGIAALDVFGGRTYDIVLMLAVYHKLRRVMPPGQLSNLVQWFGKRTLKYLGWLGTADRQETEDDMRALDKDLAQAKLERIHTSRLSALGTTAIWARS